MIAATPPYRWCTLYVDLTDPALVAAALTRLLGPGSDLDVFRVPGFTVEVHANPDRTAGPHFLDWPVLIEIDAAGTIGDQAMVAFVTGLVDHLHLSGLRVAAESAFAVHLPPPDTRPTP
jgi:hypothetical protein